MGSDHVHVAGNDEREYLLARPERLGFEDGGPRHLAVPYGQEHEDVHHLFFVDEDVSFGHFTYGGEGVLYNTHDGFVGLRGDNLKNKLLLPVKNQIIYI